MLMNLKDNENQMNYSSIMSVVLWDINLPGSPASMEPAATSIDFNRNVTDASTGRIMI